MAAATYVSSPSPEALPPEASPSVPGAARTRLLASVLLTLSAGWCVLWFLHARGFWEDDSWIHLEFARSLAQGQGWSFDGHVVYGDTSPLWVGLLDLFHLVLPDWMVAGKALTAVAAALALGAMFCFAMSLAGYPAQERRGRERPMLFAATAVLVTVANPYFAYWAFSGMEALLAAGLVCFGLTLAGPVVLRPWRFLLAALVVGLAPMLRPEMSFFSLLLGLLLVWRWWRMPGRSVPVLLAGLVEAVLPGLLWARYAVHTFGRVVPNTNAAKRANPADSVVVRLLEVYGIGFPLALVGILLLVLWWVLLRRRPVGQAQDGLKLSSLLPAGGWLLLLWTGINCVFYVVNHSFVQTRYVYVSASVLTIALLAVAAQGWPRLYRAAVVCGVVYGVGISLMTTWPLLRNKVQWGRESHDMASFFQALPPDAGVGVYSIGQVAFESEHAIVDVGGITRPGVIPYLWDESNARRVRWAEGEGARYYVGGKDAPVPGSEVVWEREIPVMGWYFRPGAYGGKDSMRVWKLPEPVGGWPEAEGK